MAKEIYLERPLGGFANFAQFRERGVGRERPTRQGSQPSGFRYGDRHFGELRSSHGRLQNGQLDLEQFYNPAVRPAHKPMVNYASKERLCAIRIILKTTGKNLKPWVW